MELQVKVTQVLEKQTINKKDGGTMDKAAFVGETFGQYPKKVKFDVMGEKLEQVMMNARVGATVTVSFDVESREWQGRWYTDLKAWKIMAMDGQGQQGQQQQQQQQQSPVPNAQAAPAQCESQQNDDLPF